MGNSAIFRHIQAYPRITQTYSVIIRTLCNLAYFMKLLMLLLVLIVSCIFRTLVFLFNLDSLHARQKSHYKRHGVTRKRSTKRLKHDGNQFRKNLQLKDVC